jgi:hypothetical protein
VFEGSDIYSTSTKSFLYTLYNTNGFRPAKISLKTGADQSTYKSNGNGPIFGAGHDLHIYNHASSNTNSYYYVHTYKPAPGCATSGYCIVLAGAKWFTVSDIEVFYETTS